jgi:bacterioferritin (cytochrome b1)
MKGNAKVIAALNGALQEELLAINQYFLHAEMCENWKYKALAKFIKKQSIDEMKSAEFFAVILKDEEEHVDWLEAQQHLINEIGYERYLSRQLGED